MPQVAISYQYGSCQDAISCGTHGHCIDAIQEYLIQCPIQNFSNFMRMAYIWYIAKLDFIFSFMPVQYDSVDRATSDFWCTSRVHVLILFLFIL